MLEDALRQMNEEHSRDYSNLKDQISSLGKLVEEERQQREFISETKLRELEGVDDRLSLQLQTAVNVILELI